MTQLRAEYVFTVRSAWIAPELGGRSTSFTYRGHRAQIDIPEGPAYVVVDVHPCLRPFADLESLRGQRLQRRFVEGFKDTGTAAVPLAEGPVVDPVEEFADGLVGLCQREELTMPQHRQDPTLSHLHGVFHHRLVPRLIRPRR